MDSMTGLMVGANCLIYSGASFLDHRPVGRVAWMEVVGGLELESEGSRKVFGMGDRIRRCHTTGFSNPSKKSAREGTYMCRVRIGDHVILYSLFFLSKTIFSRVGERLDRFDGIVHFTLIPSQSRDRIYENEQRLSDKFDICKSFSV